MTRQKQHLGILMKAIVSIKYVSPDVLELKEVEKPILRDNEVLIKIRTTKTHICYDLVDRFDQDEKYVPLNELLPFFLNFQIILNKLKNQM